MVRDHCIIHTLTTRILSGLSLFTPLVTLSLIIPNLENEHYQVPVGMDHLSLLVTTRISPLHRVCVCVCLLAAVDLVIRMRSKFVAQVGSQIRIIPCVTNSRT